MTVRPMALPNRMPHHCHPGSPGQIIAKYSCNAATVSTKKVSEKSHGAPQPTNQPRSGSPTAAVANRALRFRSTRLHHGHRVLRQLFVGAAKTAAPPLIIEQRLEIFFLAKIRPQCRRDIKLAVSDLPEKKIADTHLAASANQEIGIGHSRGVELGGNPLLIDGLRFDTARLSPAAPSFLPYARCRPGRCN